MTRHPLAGSGPALILRAIGATILLVAVVAGIPAVLLAMGADPRILIPDQWPTVTDVRQWPEHAWQTLRFAYQDGSLVRAAMLAILWCTWFLLAWMIIAEIIVQLRNGAAAATRRFSTVSPRRWISGLVTAALVLVSSETTGFPVLGPRAVAAVHYLPPTRDNQPNATVSVSSGTGQDGEQFAVDEHRESSVAHADPTWVDPTFRPELPRITVEYGDTMWDLARLHLGDGRRWTDIDALNRDRIPDPHWLLPEWVLLLPADAVNLPLPAADPGPNARTVPVEPGDTLSTIAQREYGNADAWPTLFDANRHRPQPDGRVLRDPDLILPGWILIAPTDTAETPPRPAPPTPTQPPPPQPTTTPPDTTAPAPPSALPSESRSADTATNADEESAVRWGEAFVGLALAAAISAALVMARRRFRRTYRPGSGARDDLPVAPIVHRLRMAHLRATAGPDEEHEQAAITRSPTLVIGTAGETHRPNAPAGSDVGLGVRDGREIALDLAVARGLGLVGPGASAAARALLMTLLTAETDAAQNQQDGSVIEPAVLVPRDDLAVLLDWRYNPTELPTRLRLVADLDTALYELDAEIERRTRHAEADSTTSITRVALVASAPDETTRLHDVLERGAPLGLLGVLLGQWRPGITAHVRADGQISATNPGVGEALEGTRMFQLPESDTADLLALLHQAQPGNPTGPQDDQPASASAQGSEPPAPPDDPPNTSSGLTTAPWPDGRHADDTELEVATPPRVRENGGAAGLTIGRPADRNTGRPDRPADDTTPTTSTATQAESPIAVRLLGPLRVLWRPGNEDMAVERDITDAFAPRQRELLVALAVRPSGAHRDTLLTTIWLNAPPNRPTNALNTALSRIRRTVALTTDNAVINIIHVQEGRYQLDPHTVDVDYWRFNAALSASRIARRDHERIAALQQAVDIYTGRLVDGMDAEWIDAIREATNRDALDAVAALARAHVDTDPEYTFGLLEKARTFAPHNEPIYRDIMRLQKRLGRLDAIPHTLNLLNKHLAEINERATSESIALASRLQNGGRQTPLEVGNHLV